MREDDRIPPGECWYFNPEEWSRPMTPDSLDNLMKIHPPGTKFTNGRYASHTDYFECWYNIGHTWYGKIKRGELEYANQQQSGTICDWSLYVEPKRKVKRGIYAHKRTGEVFFDHDGTLEEEIVPLILREWIKVNSIEVDEC